MKPTCEDRELVYEKPQALRVGSGRAGAGGSPAGCQGPGSGDTVCGDSGNSAVNECVEDGLSAFDYCLREGSQVVRRPA